MADQDQVNEDAYQKAIRIAVDAMEEVMYDAEVQAADGGNAEAILSGALKDMAKVLDEDL